MTVADALQAARAAGIRIDVDGNELVLRAPAPPPPAVVLELATHKPALLRVLTDLGAGPAEPSSKARSILPDWADGIAALSVDHPAAGFTPLEWERFIDDADRFCAHWALQAVELGWDAFELFGVHVRAPNARYDAMGLVPMLRGGEVVELGMDRAIIRMPSGNELTYLKRAQSSVVSPVMV